MIGVLHHIPEPESVIKLLSKILSPQGVIVINEPQAGNPIIGLLRKIRKKIDNNYSSDQVEFKTLGENTIMNLCKKKSVIYDLKNLFKSDKIDLRL